MGVYINTEMPKEGTVFVIDSAGQVWSNEWPTRGYVRIDGAMSVPVPPHGRLGDLDELANLYEMIGESGTIIHDLNRVKMGMGELIKHLETVHTIIPADKK